MDVYEFMTGRILDLLGKGTVPWHRPWNPDAGMPQNLITKRAYRGINVVLLTSSGFSSSYWLTFKQAIQLGGNVRRGERGTPVIFWKHQILEEDAETGERRVRNRVLLRYYTVFNAEQVEGIQIPQVEHRQFNPIDACEHVLAGIPNPPAIHHGSDQAAYFPKQDKIVMPTQTLFRSSEEYYSTLFHELGHATGHPDRLARKSLYDLCPFGTTNYSREELVAEMTATFLCGTAGIENRTTNNSAAYIAGWLRALKDDPKAVVIAAAQAQKAADWILGKSEAKEAAA